MEEAHYILMNIECFGKVDINIGRDTSGELILKICNLEVGIAHLLDSISNTIICLKLVHLMFRIWHLLKDLRLMWGVQLYHLKELSSCYLIKC